MSSPLFPSFDVNNKSLAANLTKAFHLLRVERRRQVIWRVATLEANEDLTVREVAKDIAAVEQDVPLSAVSNAGYRTVYTNLTQHHLLDLAEADVIEYDERAKVITPGPNVAALGMLVAVAIPAFSLLLSKDLHD